MNKYFIEQAKEVERLKKRLKEATTNNVPELYACFGKVLFDDYKWSADEIESLFNKTSNLWNDLVLNDTIKNMVDWCEQTTGIELRSKDEGIYG